MSQEKEGKPSKPYIKINTDITLKKGDFISIVPPSNKKWNKETNSFEETEVPEFVKNDLIKFNN